MNWEVAEYAVQRTATECYPQMVSLGHCSAARPAESDLLGCARQIACRWELPAREKPIAQETHAGVIPRFVKLDTITTGNCIGRMGHPGVP